MSKITLSLGSNRQGVYLDGELECEGEFMSADDFGESCLRASGKITLEVRRFNEVWLDEQFTLPHDISDVVWEDDDYEPYMKWKTI